MHLAKRRELSAHPMWADNRRRRIEVQDQEGSECTLTSTGGLLSLEANLELGLPVGINWMIAAGSLDGCQSRVVSECAFFPKDSRASEGAKCHHCSLRDGGFSNLLTALLIF